MSVLLDPEAGHATQAEAAYWRLREDIVAGRQKAGEKLPFDRLRKLYGFGLSPLREALSRLAADGLVVARGQRGYWVAPISRAEFDDITSMRLFVEPEALVRSIRNATLDWETAVVAAFHRLNRIEARLDEDPAGSSGLWEAENRRFHLALVANCGSPLLLRFAGSLAEQAQRYRRQAVALQAVPKQKLMEEHKALFDAAMGRSEGLAAELLKVHIRNTAVGLSRTLFG